MGRRQETSFASHRQEKRSKPRSFFLLLVRDIFSKPHFLAALVPTPYTNNHCVKEPCTSDAMMAPSISPQALRELRLGLCHIPFDANYE